MPMPLHFVQVQDSSETGGKFGLRGDQRMLGGQSESQSGSSLWTEFSLSLNMAFIR